MLQEDFRRQAVSRLGALVLFAPAYLAFAFSVAYVLGERSPVAALLLFGMFLILPIGVCLIALSALSTAFRRLRYLELNPAWIVLLFFCFLESILFFITAVGFFMNLAAMSVKSALLHAPLLLVPVALIVGFYVFLYHCPKVAAEDRSESEIYFQLGAAISGALLLAMLHTNIANNLSLIPGLGWYLAAIVSPIVKLPHALGLMPGNTIMFLGATLVLFAAYSISLYQVVRL